ncbi:multidrug resistance protein, MATE family [Halopseudomonas yangmingensis]|uniref:Multidrug resistance protein, MATE family n=1 Tax=Halopseudomonas yangmingensis TaxID=1720063 RepID=A0A1I4NBD3_9GAMM|nr:multidrug resistance protein, MATE family [Halopseudomonas yangmingensis]
MTLQQWRADWQHADTRRRVWALATPMILSNLSVPLVGLVDTAVVGHLQHAHYLGAVAVGSMLVTFVLWACGFLRMGTTGFAAQACGRADGQGLRLVLLQALWLAVLIAIAVVLLQRPLLELALRFIDSSPALIEQARLYVGIRLLSLPAALANLALIGWFVGLQNGRAPLYLLLLVNLANVLLDILLVMGFGWGVAGVAWATVISEYTGLLFGLWLALQLLRQHAGQFRWLDALRLRGAAPLLRVNRDILLRTLALELVFYLLLVQGARQGDAVLAANAVLLNFLMLASHGLDGLAHAIEALGGHAVGRRDRTALRRALVVSLGCSLLMSIGFALAFMLLGPWLIQLLTGLPEVRELAVRYLPWLALLPLVAVWGFLFDGLFIGATRAREMRNAMLGSVLLVYLPLAWLLRDAGNHGLWLGFHLFMLARGLSLAGCFVWLWRRGRWIPD